MDLVVQHRLPGIVLALEDVGGAVEFPDLRVHRRELDDRAVRADIAVQDRQSALFMDRGRAGVDDLAVRRCPASGIRSDNVCIDASNKKSTFPSVNLIR